MKHLMSSLQNIFYSLFSQVSDRASEASTHGNLGIAYQAVGDHALATKHFGLHLRMAEELNDVLAQCRALNNLGQHCVTSGDPAAGIPYLEHCLKLSVQLKDRACEFKACNHLGQVRHVPVSPLLQAMLNSTARLQCRISKTTAS